MIILFVGDFFNYLQLGKPQYSVRLVTVMPNYNHSGSLWVDELDELQMIVLNEVMRKRNESAFCELLCRVKTAKCNYEYNLP